MKYISIISILYCIGLSASNNINTPMPLIPTSGTVTTVQSQKDKELIWVDEQIQAILPSRVGVSDGYINSLLDPMKYTKSIPIAGSKSALLAPPKLGGNFNTPLVPKVILEPLKLQAILNKSALINGKWYKVNDSIRNYTLSDVKMNSVLLVAKKGEPLVLFLAKTNNNIKINTK